jgi:tetratricopeptide (TPR) repeat protein
LLALLEVPVEDQQWQAFDPLQRRRLTLEAIKHLLLRESQVQPLCLIFEDLHWIDAETQALLDSLVESLPTARLLLQAIVDAPDEALHRGLAHLQAAEFLYETCLFPEREYTFKHALTHEVAYGALLRERQRLLHGRIVAVIEQRYADRLADQVERLAHHALRGKVWDKAVVYCRQAGDKALARSANREAVACFEQALAALAHLPEGRARDEQAIDVRFGLRHALNQRRERDRVLTYLREAEGLAQALGRAYYGLGDYPRAIDLLQQNVVALEGIRLREHFSLPGLPSVTSRDVLARCLAEVGAFTEGLARGEESLRIAEAVDHPDSLINACRGLGHVYLHQGAWPQAIVWLERGREVCRMRDIPLLLYLVSSTLGYAYVLAGRVSDALPLLEPSASTEGVGVLRGRVHGWLSEAYLRLGRRDDALAVAERGLELCRTHAQQGEQAWTLRFLGEIHAHRHPPETTVAEAAYREALALAEALGMRPLQAHCHRSLGTLYAKIGRREQAHAELSAALELYWAMDMTFWLPQTETALSQVEGR